VIIDDGWQTLDASRGYAFTGDWEPERIPDLAGHVARLHQIGMKVILWYSVPFVGMQSKAWSRLEHKLLYRLERGRRCGVVDPRYPEVRDWLITTYERAVREWDLDGLKLDFVDRFVTKPETPRGAENGRDIASVQEAVHRLLADVMDRLRRIKPDILIEFRQAYVGPLMRVYGNMFRAMDCPADHVRNRISVVDIRLLCGETACHGDMLMWHMDEPAESAALQLLAVFFAVPQISVRLDRLPAPHAEMLAFWMEVWNRHRDVLLYGELSARSPELNYPLVTARTDDQLVAAAYGDLVVPLAADAPGRILLIQANRQDRLVIDLEADLGERQIDVRDCRGRLVSSERRHLAAGPHRLTVPSAGVAELTRP
jgi:alpha-galactosidase